MNANEFRVGSIVDVINRRGKVHIPTGVKLRVIAVGLFQLQCVPNSIPTHQATGGNIMNIPLKDICRIPLTEEWLQKFGFIKDGFGSWNISINPFDGVKNPFTGELTKEFKILSFAMNMEYLYIRSGNTDRRNEDDINVIWNKDVMKVFYVHQLQNLYFALTGEELTIVEPETVAS